MSSIIQTYSEFDELVEDRVSTSNATVTDCITIAVPVSRALLVKVDVIGSVTDFTGSIGGTLMGLFRRQSSGDIIQVGSIESVIKKSATLATTDILFTLDNSGYNIKLQVQGKAATNMVWSMKVNYTIQI